jgi:hypothetical protein
MEGPVNGGNTLPLGKKKLNFKITGPSCILCLYINKVRGHKVEESRFVDTIYTLYYSIKTIYCTVYTLCVLQELVYRSAVQYI